MPAETGHNGVDDEENWAIATPGSMYQPQEQDEAYTTPKAQRISINSCSEHFQVENYNKALQKSNSKLSSFFRRRTGTKTPATPPPGLSPMPSAIGQNTLSLDEMLTWSVHPIPTSLLKLSNDHTNRAVKMFNGLLKYCNDADGGDDPSQSQRLEIAMKLLHQGLKRPELKDELYMQLIKQTRSNPYVESRMRAWELMHIIASAMPPSKEFVGLVSEYIHNVTNDSMEDPEVAALAQRTLHCLKRSAKAGPRRTLPSMEELEATMLHRPLSTIVFFLDETFEELEFDITTTVAEAVEVLAGIIHLDNFSTFTLFECRRAVSLKAMMLPEAATDEHMLLDDHRYIADVLTEFRNPKFSRDGVSSRLLFKKRMFRETDELILETQFINLSYVQAQHDYLQGNYPVVREDAAQMCALQIEAEYGSTLCDDDEAVMQCIQRYVTKQLLMTRPREEWRMDIMARYRALEQFSKEDARVQFLRILRTLPYGNAVFFTVKRIEDPIGLLPAKLILGINKRGLHFFRPVPKEYLHSAELRDIMQFGSSSQAVFFKMRVAGVLHIFQFESKQGEDICMALQTHINDIMSKRYHKTATKAMNQSQDGSLHHTTSNVAAQAAAALANNAPLPNAHLGPVYQDHVTAMQHELEAAKEKLEEQQKRETELRYDKEQLQAELQDLTEHLHHEEDARNALLDQVAVLQRELTETRNELDVTKASYVNSAAAQQEHDTRVQDLEVLLDARSKEVEEAHARVAAVEKQLVQLAKEKELIEKKIGRLEKAKEQETNELKARLEETQAEARTQIAAKDARINEVIDKLAETNSMYEAARAEAEQIRADEAELEELREMRADIERKDKQHAMIIENQARRLDELEKLYKEEQVNRKKYFNQMEDMKGKIRVFCRVRPILPFETDKGANFALNVQDELTISHTWRDEKKPREYGFDVVFGPQVAQEAVFEDTRHLVQSAVDGYNVCIFAYGQTGSGKTFTIYGSEKEPGLTPRGVQELFRIIERDGSKYTFSIRLYMLELYQDSLADLLLPPPRQKNAQPAELPRLEIKKDQKGMVTVMGATVIEVTSSRELMAALEAGQQRRHTSSTQMNRESSRSHLIMSIIIESTNLQTQSVTKGKLSFVDLAGSERVKKSGSVGENLKEAQAINKSLSALGDVISALATEQQHIPYRNHKLTMLMSDSLGGNAKTLMFVNVSPSDGNLDETQNSLVYATRVRTIKNDASKNETNKETLKLRKAIEYWKEQAGLQPEQRAAVDMVDITDARSVISEE